MLEGLCLRADPEETLLLAIYDEKDHVPAGSTSSTLESIKNAKAFPQDTIELDTHAVISKTWSLNIVSGTDKSGAPKKQRIY